MDAILAKFQVLVKYQTLENQNKNKNSYASAPDQQVKTKKFIMKLRKKKILVFTSIWKLKLPPTPQKAKVNCWRIFNQIGGTCPQGDLTKSWDNVHINQNMI